MNLIPHSDVIKAIGCDYCQAPAGVQCITDSGCKCEPHKARLVRGRSIIRQQASATRQADPRIEVRVMSLETQMRATLVTLQHSAERNERLAEQVLELSEIVRDQMSLTSMLRQQLVREATQLVLDGLDSDDVSFEDVQYIDESLMGEILRPVMPS